MFIRIFVSRHESARAMMSTNARFKQRANNEETPPVRDVGTVALKIDTWAYVAGAAWFLAPSSFLLGICCFMLVLAAVRRKGRESSVDVAAGPILLVASYIAVVWLSALNSSFNTSNVVLTTAALCLVGWLSTAGHAGAQRSVVAGTELAMRLYASLTVGDYLLYLAGIELQSQVGFGARRATAIGMDPNHTATILGITLAIVAVYKVCSGIRLTRLDYVWYLAVAAAILLTASRQGLIMVTFATIFVIMKRSFVLLFGILITFGALLFSGDSLIPALQKGVGAESAGGELRSDALRVALWEQGVATIREGRLLGVGPANSFAVGGQVAGRPISLHSSFITIGVELGILGIVAALSLMIYSYVKYVECWGAFLGIGLISLSLFSNAVTTFVHIPGPFVMSILCPILGARSLSSRGEINGNEVNGAELCNEGDDCGR